MQTLGFLMDYLYVRIQIRKNNTMNINLKNKAEYLVIFISEFARKYNLSQKQAFRYLSQYKAIELINEQYDIIHTLDLYSMVEDIATYCRRYGGAIV